MVTAGMLPRAAVREVEARLCAAGCPDADFDAAELFRLAVGGDARLADAPLSAEQAERLEALTARRAAREPLQYLCGSWPFLDFELAVGPGVLCPRADTEVVAEAAAGMLAGVEAPRVLDLCAGTGCLGLGVKRFCPAAQVTGLEKSPAAYRYLEQNAHLSPALTITPVQGDLFTYWQTLPEGQLDLIVSNPPYPDRRRDGRAAARGGAGACHGAGSRGGWAGILPRHCGTLPASPASRRCPCPGDRLAAAGGRDGPACRQRVDGYRVQKRPFGGNDRCVMGEKTIKISTTSCCNICKMCYTSTERNGMPAPAFGRTAPGTDDKGA